MEFCCETLKDQVKSNVQRDTHILAKIAEQWRHTVVLWSRPLYTNLAVVWSTMVGAGARRPEIAVYYIYSEQNGQAWTGKVWLEYVSWDHPACQYRPHTWSQLATLNAQSLDTRHTHTYTNTHTEIVEKAVASVWKGDQKVHWPPVRLTLDWPILLVLLFHSLANA